MNIAVILFALAGMGQSGFPGSAPDGVPFTVADRPWPVDGLGNHRAIVRVGFAADFVRAHLPWRRRDRDVKAKAVIVTPLADIHKTLTSAVVRSDSDSADVVFSPSAGPGLYACYYLPYRFDLTEGWTNTKYIAPSAPSPWAAQAASNWSTYPSAATIRFEARTSFDSFAPMELPANRSELDALRKRSSRSYLVFPEVRTRPVRMFDRIPAIWAGRGPSSTFSGEARPNEYYVFQLGVWGHDLGLQNVKLNFSDLVARDGRRLSASRLTCFNLGGTNWDGTHLSKRVDVAKGTVQPLWVGVDLPGDIRTGTFEGKIRVVPANAEPSEVSIRIRIAGKPLADRGDSELWRYARLRWLNSSLGTSDVPIPPYGPVRVRGNRLEVLGRSITLGADGLPSAIMAGGNPVLAGPIILGPGSSAAATKPLSLRQVGPGRVNWTAQSSSRDWDRSTKGELEFDGHASIVVSLKAKREMELGDLPLVVSYAPQSSLYFMGIGHRGGFAPTSYMWDWKGPFDSWWIGGVRSGMQVELRGGSYQGPLLNLYHPLPPPSWFNGGKGRVALESKDGRATVRVATGPRHFHAGEEIRFELALLITPVKPIDTHWQFLTRFYHNAVEYRPVKEAIAAGANVVNVHHANDINPYINYPFIAVQGMQRFVNEQHSAGRKVKIYDTIRELSNYTSELWPLLSLDGEVFVKGDGGGFAWLQEHVGSGYVPSWYHPYPQSGTADASIVTTGFSRWINYYVEGLAWLAKNVKIDGLYLDDVSFDRRVLKRMRRVLGSGGRAPMIDLHSNTGFSIGPANQYTEFFPYVDRLWFGESFDYDHMSADQWLVETSGIPFGEMGEMLQGGGNRWLGMLFGMTTRFGWTNYLATNNPDPIWRFWDEFGIAESEMIGFWDPRCPVKCDSPDLQATVYRRRDRTLIAVANFGVERKDGRLSIDWKALGMDPSSVKLIAPAIENYQAERRFAVGEAIPIEPKRGWLIVLSRGR